MPGGFNRIRVYWDHDSNTWYAVTGKDTDHQAVQLSAVDLVSAESEAASGLASRGFTLVSGWKDLGNIEAGSLAVYAEQGAAADTKAHLRNVWVAHKAVMVAAGIDPATLTANQKAMLIGQNILLSGILKLLMDKGLITGDDIDTACSAVSAVDSSWFQGM